MSGVPMCRTATGIRHVALALAVVAVVAGGGAPANAASGWDIDVGLAGAFRAGSWTPLRLAPRAGADAMAGDRVFVWAQDPDGEFVRAPAASLRPAADGGLEAHTCVRVGRPTARVFIERVPQAAGDVGLAPVTPSEGAIEMLLAEPIPSTHRVLIVLGELLPRDATSPRLEFKDYAFDQRDLKLPQRRESWTRIEHGWRLETQQGSAPAKIVQEFDDSGKRVRRVDLDGSVTELIELEDLRALWKAKGLPVD